MADLRPFSSAWLRLRSAWSHNDGKPREEWGRGLDLKEAVMIGMLMVVVVVLIGLVATA
jgi:hypothetical protein